MPSAEGIHSCSVHQSEERDIRMTHEPTNADRAEWARVAIAAFAAETHLDTSGELEHDLESVVCDLVADLMHFCDEESLDWKEIIRRAELHHSEEVEQESERNR